MRNISYLSAPVHVWWDITRQCNLKCKHCYSRSSSASENELTTEKVMDIIDQLKSIKVGYVYILGGEPLMRPDFAALLEYFSKLDIPLMLNTNGWFVDHAWVARLSKSSLRHLRFSIDGASPETHDAFRRMPGSFERVVKGIMLCREAGISAISCSFTMTKENIQEIMPTVRLLVSLGVNQVQFGPISNTGRASEHSSLLLDAEDTREIAGILGECIDSYGDKIHIYSVDGTYDKPCTKCVKRGLVKPMFMGCSSGRTSCCIDWEGRVLPCILWREHAAGSLMESSFRDIWDNSPLFQHLRRHRGDDYPECNDCRYGDVCARECPMSPSQKSHGLDQRREQLKLINPQETSEPCLERYCLASRMENANC